MRAWVAALVFLGTVSALSVTLTSPSDGLLSSSASHVFSFTVDSNVSWCALYSNQSGWAAVQNQSSATSLNHSMPADGSYLWGVSCADANGTSFSSNRTLRVDATAPSAVSNLSASGTTSATLSWNASSDNSSVTYTVSRNGTAVSTGQSGLAFSEAVTSGQSYNYSVQAVDAAGNAGPAQNVVFHAPAASVAISGLSVSTTPSTATFTWTNTPAANASVSYGNQTAVLGIVSNPTPGSSPSLSIAGLSAAMTYPYNVTACTTTCTQVSGSFATKPSSYPSPSQIQNINSTASLPALFSAFWTDSLNLSHYVFSTNVSGSWVNTTYAFNGSYSNHSMILPSTAMTIAWQFFANNSQNAFNFTPVKNVTVQLPAPSATPTPAVATPFPTIPPQLVKATPTPEAPAATPTPTLAPVEEASAEALPSAPPNFSGQLVELVVNAEGAEFGLSPEGLLVSLVAPNATVSFASQFNNTGSGVTVVLRSELTGDSGVLLLESDPVTVRSGQSIHLETRPQTVPSGVYDVKAEVVNLEAGTVLFATTGPRVHIQSTAKAQNAFTGLFSGGDASVAFGGLALVLGVGVFLVQQLASLKKEF
ncbi:hypothetical protein HY572_04060 [Candidatus Micrarchaeota archaeon]|nr:hypothetical protein [Candidatus Micrarchaeota archaeon]